MILIQAYILFSSIILLRGIGLDRLMICAHAPFDFFYYIRNFVIAILASGIAYFFMKVTQRFIPLVPFILITLLLLLDILADVLFKNKTRAPHEKNFSYGIPLLALFESYSLLSLCIIVFGAFVCLLFYEILLKSINKIVSERATNYYMRLASLSLISLGIITALLSAL